MKHIKLIIPTLLIITLISVLVYTKPSTELNITEASDITTNTSSIAFYIQEESGDYTTASTIPEKNTGYVFSSYSCDGDATITFNNIDWNITISNMSANETKCKLYFDIDSATARTYILSNIDTISERTSFTSIVTASSTGLIYVDEDDYGETYYYAGAAEDNYLIFANMWWRIVRINGDGTIRLLYAGSTDDYSTGLANGYDDSSTLYETIGTYAYGSGTQQRFVGYYNASNNLHGTSTASNIASTLNTWYEENLLDYEDYISTSTIFCNDRTAYTDTSGTTAAVYSDDPIYYGAYIRLYTNYEPTFKCSDSSDAFSVTSSDGIGNSALTHPIGLITADEISYAGGVYNTSNGSYYLYTNTVQWTISPAYYTSSSPRMWHIGAPGGLNFTSGLVTATRQTRPVINLSKDVTLSGSGTSSDPYTVVTE